MKRGRRFFPLTDERINLVSDPIVLEKDSQKRAQNPQSPAEAWPGRAEACELRKNVNKVCRNVAGVRQKCQD